MASNKSASAMREFMERVLREIGPRPPCSPQERRLGSLLRKEWGVFCDQVDTHSFRCHPTAWQACLPWLVLSYLLCLAAYWLFPPVALVLVFAAVLVGVLQVIRLRELLDFLFPSAEGQNIVGVIRPAGAIQRRVILSAHQDSAWECNLWLFFRKSAVPLMALAALAFLWMLFGSLAATLAWVLEADDHIAYTIVGWVGMALYPVVGLFVFFTSWTPVPGAMDDLAGVAVISEAGRSLARERLQSTEVLLVAMSAEEAGLRGSRRFVARHRSRLERIPTSCINLDGIADPAHLAVLEREYCVGARHDPAMVELAEEAGRSEGLNPLRKRLFLGGSDAASFSQSVFPATTLICQDTSRLVPNYHTRHDTLEHVQDAALDATLRLALAMLARIDQGALEHSLEAEPTGWAEMEDLGVMD